MVGTMPPSAKPKMPAMLPKMSPPPPPMPENRPSIKPPIASCIGAKRPSVKELITPIVKLSRTLSRKPFQSPLASAVLKEDFRPLTNCSAVVL